MPVPPAIIVRVGSWRGTDPTAAIGRRFEHDAMDITAVLTGEGNLYLVSVLDRYSHRQGAIDGVDLPHRSRIKRHRNGFHYSVSKVWGVSINGHGSNIPADLKPAHTNGATP
jgi:hypothetical protein